MSSINESNTLKMNIDKFLFQITASANNKKSIKHTGHNFEKYPTYHHQNFIKKSRISSRLVTC